MTIPPPTPFARLIGAGFKGYTLNDDIRSLIDRGVTCVILFAHNVESPSQVAKLCHDLKQYAGRPLLVMTDQEGGPTARLREGFTTTPSMRALGAHGCIDTARELGQVIGRELRAVGIDMDLAPVLDVDTNPANPVIGRRSISNDPQIVAELSCALIEGIQSQGVAACGKHFPGHGDTAQDSHFDLPRLPHDMQRLESIELVPFRAASAAGIASFMSAHIIFEAIDESNPSTLSAKVIEGVLRHRIGFAGLLISDCMEMKAIADPRKQGDIAAQEHVPAAVVRGIRAGLDIALVSHRADLAHAAIDQLEAAAASGDVPAERIAQAQERLDVVLTTYAAAPVADPDLSILNCEAHQKIAAKIGEETQVTHDPTEAIGGAG